MPEDVMDQITAAEMERVMRVQDVMLQATARKITWWQAVEILGIRVGMSSFTNIWMAHSASAMARTRSANTQRRGVAHDASAAPDKRGASASVPPKTLRPTGSAGLHSSRRPSLVGKKTKQRRNAGTKELECYRCSLKCIVNYGQLVCYKKRPSSRANDRCTLSPCLSLPK